MKVSEAFAAVDRREFLLPEHVEHYGVDAPLSIGHGQTNSQPRTVADMLTLLDVRPGHRVLDIGAGSGWSTALLATLTGPEGAVLGVELVPELVTFGSANLAKFDFPHASIRQATDDVYGLPAEAPFDRILVSAQPRELPEELVEQLHPDGVMVIPVAGTMLRVLADGSATRHGLYRFVPLKPRR
ncbi:protein-L-isoaspartate O-methyltransferase family protein [Corynebacterium doosanense]|uniref:Protein-L-isoaspartate O-methyltransferase n=1 Tax=Corynebacterium doosanense CAU 212 = DSM 45436 TaxID=558173 RepID=A0A097IF18_9CORY|nr:protein-L-isoaspartate O-methyltransferase [Corynebacterium doosanense]AIT60719.1 protein-L-isoaspartate carboxylmethyltransferase [Corynebacterium doosanense CAU 212 = DSM 45436]